MKRETLLAITLAVAVGISGANAEDIRARGVNPAENDTRFDIILKNNWLSNRASILTTTLKFDYRITPEMGLNFELPVLGHFRSASLAPGFPGLNDTGLGDVFLRFRYIAPIGVSALGATSIGGALEGVLPTASERTLGSGSYQLNATALLVQAWTPTLITAFVAKATQSIDEQADRPRVQENTVRAVQAFILPGGRFVTLDGRYNWETLNRRDVWWEGQVEFGMMLDASAAVSVAFSRRWGDRADRGALSLSFRQFF